VLNIVDAQCKHEDCFILAYFSTIKAKEEGLSCHYVDSDEFNARDEEDS
jgi:hypothetical protein